MDRLRVLIALIAMVAGAPMSFAASEGVRALSFSSAAILRAGDVPAKSTADAVFYRRKASLLALIDWAYDTTRARTVGGPDWMDDLAWQVIGRSDRRNPRDADVKQMVRSLLADRFKLQADFQTRPTSAVLISVDSVGGHSAIRKATASVNCEPFLNGDKALVDVPQDKEGNPLCGPSRGEHESHSPVYHFRSAPLTAVARQLEIMLDRAVVWTPPTQGLFDVDFATPESYSMAVTTPDLDAFMDALEAQFGAKVEVRTVPVRVLVVGNAVKPTLDRP